MIRQTDAIIRACEKVSADGWKLSRVPDIALRQCCPLQALSIARWGQIQNPFDAAAIWFEWEASRTQGFQEGLSGLRRPTFIYCISGNDRVMTRHCFHKGKAVGLTLETRGFLCPSQSGD